MAMHMMEKLIGRKGAAGRKTKDSTSAYDDGRHEVQRGFVPLMVGRDKEEEVRFMVPIEWIHHPSILALLQLSANEFGYHQQGVLHVPCQPRVFKQIVAQLSSNKR